VAAAALLLAPVPARTQNTLQDLFQKGKNEFKTGQYQASMATLKQLEELSQAPGNESARVKLEPLISFYRGCNFAALGEDSRASVEFETYLAAFPSAHLDPSAFPKKVLEVFNRTQERGAASLRQPPAEVKTSLETEFARFQDSTDQPLALEDERWGTGAMRFLMTKEERERWKKLQDRMERAEFVLRFWEKRDPTPLTPENEFRSETERRIRFADLKFSLPEHRGSDTDRGLVFVLLGPPSYVGQSPLRSEDDPMQVSRNAPTSEIVRNADGSTSTLLVPRIALTAETLQGTRETWHYRRDRLPKEVQFTEVNFDFLTKDGAGVGVLQRGRDVLMTLEAVAKTMLPKKKE
jgi:GWxTD domain-containing protein